MPKMTKILTGVCLVSAGWLGQTPQAMAQQLPAYKDSLFDYSKTLSTSQNGAFEEKDFDEMRDVNGRDSIPVKRSKEEYVDQSIIGSERKRRIEEAGTHVSYLVVGSERDAKFVVIFAHGTNGTEELGMQDWTFGGNFNRLKHYALNENGAYYSPTFTDFDDVGGEQIKILLKNIRKDSPSAKIILACASSGGGICQQAFFQPESLKNISGFVLMSAGVASSMFSSKAIANYRGAVLLQHGERDKLVNWKRQFDAFSAFQSAHPDFPVRYQLYKTGGHGTPIRMIDWREVLNWMFRQS